ncbi:MAG TPA: N-acetylmuramoyl-L-alanine amidase [Xanthobacteraceae bacterium]|nr:N-acetylmuramoyl-L-alanine amidase [Xanthobacteraceae bacterium]
MLAPLVGAVPAAAQDAAPAAKAPACPRDQFKVVLDIGHTSESPGAISARGASEYGFNFVLTRQIEQHQRKAGFSKTSVLVTQGQARPSLFRRVAQANKLAGDLLLSIHHDSVPERFKQTWQFAGKTFEFSDRFRGHSLFISNNNADRKGSLLFGSLLGRALAAQGMTYTPHYTEKFMGNRRRELVDAVAGVYRYDQLIVLKNTHMPAVLFEAGSIVNRDEELDLLSEKRQAAIGDAVTQAVDAFCIARTTPQAPLVASSSRARPALKPPVIRPKSIALQANGTKRQ